MRRKNKHRTFGIIVFICSLLATAIFTYSIARANFLPVIGVIMCAVAFILVELGILAFSLDSRKKLRTTAMAILSIIIILIQILGSYYLLVGFSALEKITNVETEKSEVGVYVRVDDPAKSLEDAKKYTFGILEVQDRDVTDAALSKIANILGKAVKTKEYGSIEELMNALLETKEVYAIILNKSFLELFEELEGHENDAEKIREIHSIIVESEKVMASAPKADQSVFSVYISGIDCYGSIKRRSRSDVNIIATVNTETAQILLLSTPRDYYVPLSISNGAPDKLTHAGIYGIDVSRDTLAELYGTDIDYYFRVNFDGFKDIIDALDGISVYSEYEFKDLDHSFKKGVNQVNGEQALAFARSRYAFASGDNQRGKNQMAVVKGVIEKAIGPAIIMNYKEILNGLTGSFDTNMPYDTVTELIKNQIINRTKWNIVSYSVKGTGASMKPYSLSTNAYVMIPDEETVDHAKELINKVKNGEILKDE